ncbi:hypothetical protein [Gymnodinialimonas sp.]
MRLLRRILTTRLLRGAVIAFGTLILLLWYFETISELDRVAPNLTRPGDTLIEVPTQGEVVIGRPELGQPRGRDTAALDHIAFRQDPVSGAVLLRRVTDQRRLWLSFGDANLNGVSDRVSIPWREPGNAIESEDRLQIAITGNVIELHVSPDNTVNVSIFAEDVGVTPVAPDEPFLTGALVANYEIQGNGWANRNDINLSYCTPRPDGFFDRWSRRLAAAKRLTSAFQASRRHVAVLGGLRDCVLGSQINMFALPSSDPRVEIAINWFLGTERADVRVAQIAGGAAVSFRRIEGGQVVFSHAGARRFDWPVTALPLHVDTYTNDVSMFNEAWDSHQANAAEVVRFIAGRTHYHAAVLEGDAGARHVLLRVTEDGVGTLRDVDFCASGTPEAEGIDMCPEARLDKPVESFEEALPRPMERLYQSFFTHHLDPKEQLVWLVIVSSAALFGAVATRRRLQAAPILEGIPIALGFVVAALLLLVPIWLPFSADALEIKNFGQAILIGNLLLFFVAGLFVALDQDGSWLSGGLWLTLIAIVFLGAASLFHLSAGGFHTSEERYFVKHLIFGLWPLPFLVIVMVVIPAQRFRISLGADVTGKMNLFSPLLWLFSVTLLGFVAWLLIGAQDGLDGFQPVEFGKFVVVVGLAVILSLWLVTQRKLNEKRAGLSGLAYAVVVGLALFVPLVPIARSDYSPLIIIVSVSLIVISLMMTATGLRIMREGAGDDFILSLVPIRFRPRTRYPGMLRAAWIGAVSSFWANWTNASRPFIAVLVLLALALPAVLWASRDVPVRVEPFGVSGWSWSAEETEQMEVLLDSLGTGRRLVKERLMIWVDLFMPGGPTAESYEANVDLPDLGFQVMRSRASIAHAPCGFHPALVFGQTGPASSPPLDPAATEQMECHVSGDALFGSCFLERRGICEAIAPDDWAEPTRDCRATDLRLPAQAHCIPVVESDFAVTFLLAEFGIGAGLFLVAVQFTFTALALFTVYRLVLPPWPMAIAQRGGFDKVEDEVRTLSSMPRDPVLAAGGKALAVLVLGSILLYQMQWILAWSNSMGLLPVMGQPMTWLSAATSHHLFMAIPAALTILMGARVVEAQKDTVSFNWVPLK